MVMNNGVQNRHRALRNFIFVLVLAASFVAAVSAYGDYERGVQAWGSGNISEAISEWMAAADAEDGRAMLALGRAYRQGLGVLQDYVEAHKWFNLAAARGNADALAEREALAEKMTSQQLAEAQKRAREWQLVGDNSEQESTVATVQGDTGESEPVLEAPPPEAIRQAQALLAALGYRPGPADGLWGKRSIDAYRSFLRDTGLPAGDVLTPSALRAMRDIAAQQGVEPDAGANVSSRAAPPPDTLHRAAKAGNVAGLKAALDSGADPDRVDAQGWTALMHAVNKSYLIIVELLIEADANVDVRASDGATALFMASVLGDAPIIAQLMKSGADVSIPGPRGKTAAEIAKAVFGEANDARAQGLDEVVVGLIEGRTSDEVRQMQARREKLKQLYPDGKLQDCDVCPEMVVVPAGSFMMGSPKSEERRGEDEGPVHRVTISDPFAVGRFEVTRAQYAVFAESTRHTSVGKCWIFDNGWKESDTHSWRDPGFGQGEDDPVVCVSWEDAQAYARWLTDETGEGYRLLTESEWEYVARAGTTGPFHFGSTISTDQANYHGNYTYGGGSEGRYRERTVSVGSFPANSFGLHDMHGNVWEWVEGCWHDSYDGAPSDGSVWTSGGDCSLRVLRGGSWYSKPGVLRSANRSWNEAGYRVYNYGFRVARTLAP